jgi:hypothetical protein
MENSQLRAAIPTNEKWAADSKGWEMPNSTLLKELRKRCIAPILRPDQAKPNSLAVELTL